MSNHDRTTREFREIAQEVEDLEPPTQYMDRLQFYLGDELGHLGPEQASETRSAITGLLRWAVHEAVSICLREAAAQGRDQETELRRVRRRAQRAEARAEFYRNALLEIGNSDPDRAHDLAARRLRQGYEMLNDQERADE